MRSLYKRVDMVNKNSIFLVKMSSNSVKEFREKLKLPENSAKLEIYREKQKEYDRRYVLKQLQNTTTAKKYYFNKRESKRKQKIKSKENKVNKVQETSKLSHYSSISAKSKAIGKALKALPKNVDKRKEILQCLAVRDDVMLSKPKQSAKKPRNGFEDIKKLVLDFFSLDFISRQLPGMKDYVTTQNESGFKTKVQKRVLLMTLKDAHQEYSKLFADYSLSFSKFCMLRPAHVQLFTTEIHYSCGCIYCSNMQLLLDAVDFYVHDFKYQIEDLMIKMNCHRDNYDCVSSMCDECSDSFVTLKQIVPAYCFDEVTKYKEWKKVDGYVQKVLVSNVSVEAVIQKISNDMKYFKMHNYIKKIQQHVFADSKSNQKSDSVTMVVDFSENYSTKGQFEVQSSYFGRRQISLFTCVAYIGLDLEENYLVASDDTTHSKEQVYAYLKLILKDLKSKFPELKNVKLFSDGAPSQFKNRFTIGNLVFAKQDFDLEIEWHFFSTAHGKSSADGIGGIVKRGVYYRVLSDQWTVYCAADFVRCAQSFVKKINVIEIETIELNSDISMLQQRWKNLKSIPGIRDCHFFKPSSKFGCIMYAKSSILDDVQEVNVLKKLS